MQKTRRGKDQGPELQLYTIQNCGQVIVQALVYSLTFPAELPVKRSTQPTQQHSTQQVSVHNSASLDSRALNNTTEITETVSRQTLAIL